ncbi:prepilin-type N-terminal cleavage/methylation domain-containing protein [Candidatus Saccharibacteria bacterium]|nr:prepilin-type N-terminal cleavage/methylation domain-containing protein [Candidatus Saccharibacteria bacterium]
MKVFTQKGFTIVELMIASAVFSTILLVILTAIVQVGKMYYKGITTAKTQESARTVLDRISQDIQYSGGGDSGKIITKSSTNNDVKSLCIGSDRYFYRLNVQQGASGHVLWFDRLGADGCDPDSVVMSSDAPTADGSEILPEGMRIVKLNVQSSATNLWSVSVKVAFGADDLLETTDGSQLADSPELAVCKGSAVGTQFCAVSELNTTVLKRIP